MKKSIGTIVLLGALILSACSSSNGEIEVHEPWARASMQGENSAIYFTMHNHTENAEELLSVSSDIADIVEIHESFIDSNGVMKMNFMDLVPLAPDAEIEFAPGGLHVMLIGLKKELMVGDTFDAILHFKNYEDIPITVTILDESGNAGTDDMHDMATPTP